MGELWKSRKKARAKFINQVSDQGGKKCPDCGHDGWTHGRRGCVAFSNEVPTKLKVDGNFKVRVVDIPKGKAGWEYYCSCMNSTMCKGSEKKLFG